MNPCKKRATAAANLNLNGKHNISQPLLLHLASRVRPSGYSMSPVRNRSSPHCPAHQCRTSRYPRTSGSTISPPIVGQNRPGILSTNIQQIRKYITPHSIANYNRTIAKSMQYNCGLPWICNGTIANPLQFAMNVQWNYNEITMELQWHLWNFALITLWLTPIWMIFLVYFDLFRFPSIRTIWTCS